MRRRARVGPGQWGWVWEQSCFYYVRGTGECVWRQATLVGRGGGWALALVPGADLLEGGTVALEVGAAGGFVDGDDDLQLLFARARSPRSVAAAAML